SPTAPPSAGRPGAPGAAGDPPPATTPWTSVAAQRRGERPRVPTGRPIADYRDDELDAVVAWICSDTLLRTHEQLAALVRQQLGFVRRSGTLDAAVSAAIRRVVARGDVSTADGPADTGRAAGEHHSTGRNRPGSGVEAHDPHERWLLDQRPPHWD
ncbi:MAG TPA: hypothetical protein VFL94_06890, partial [Actinomycetales bacterium]|nr:hypothetical protein [Actinomycetales bacterium]